MTLGWTRLWPKGRPLPACKAQSGEWPISTGSPIRRWPPKRSRTPSRSCNCTSMFPFPAMARSPIPSASPSAPAKREPTPSSALTPVVRQTTEGSTSWLAPFRPSASRFSSEGVRRRGSCCFGVSCHLAVILGQSMLNKASNGQGQPSSDGPFSNDARREATMFSTRRTTTPLRQETAPQRSPARLLVVVLALSALLLLLSGCGSSKSTLTAPVAHAQPVRLGQLSLALAPSISTTMRIAQRRLYSFSRSNVGLMQLAVDGQGMVCVGEMHTNRLGCLNSRTGVVTSWTPPGAQYGIMTTTFDAQGNAWFAEQYANYLGRFDPRQQTFRIFPLGTWKGSPLGPQDLHFDGRGFLWFTAAMGGAIGRLDPSTGAIRIWPVPSRAPGIPSSPSSLTVTLNGQVWFGDYADGTIGTLDPMTGQITLYDLPNPQAQVFSMAADTTGRIWFTEVLPGKLGMFDPTTDTLTELPVPALAGRPPALYQLVLDHQGNIWFVDVGADMLVRYAPGKQTLTFFQLSLPGSVPFGLTLDPAGKLWFTAGGSSGNYVGEMAP